MKKYYVVSTFDDRGKTTADMYTAAELPETYKEIYDNGGYKETKKCDIYVDAFKTRKEAEQHIEDTYSA